MRSTQSCTRWSALLVLTAFVLSGPAAAAAAETSWSPVPVDGGAVASLGAGGSGDSLVAWATTEGAGVFRSADGGRTWTRSRTPHPRALLAGVDPRDGSRAFAMFLRPGIGYAANGLFFTADGGATWSRAGLPARLFIYQVSFHPTAENVLFAATFEGLYRSGDGGRTWNLAGGLTGGVFTVAVAPDDPRIVLASTHERVVRSTDGGVTFTEVFGSALSLLAFDPSDPDRVYGTSGILFRSSDRGLTWQQIGQPFGARHDTLAVDRNGTLYTGSDLGVIRSTDGGATFLPQASPARRFPDDAIRSVLALPDGNVLASGLRGVWRLAAGEERWRASSRGIRALDIAGLAVTGDGRVLAGVPWNGIFYSDDGASFRSGTRGLSNPFVGMDLKLVPAPSDPRIVYGSSYHVFYRSDDGGVTWRELNTPYVGQLVRIVAVDPTDPDTVYAGGPEYHPRDDAYKCHAERSRDGGATWTCLQGDDLYALEAVVFDPERPRRLLAFDGDRFVISDDQGDTWRASGHGLPADEGLNPVLVRDGQGRLFVTSYEGRVYRSVNGGASFAPLGRILPEDFVFVLDLISDPRHPDTLYAAVFGQGIFRSRNGGRTWQRLGTGLPAALFAGVAALDVERGLLYAGTQGRGLYRIDVP